MILKLGHTPDPDDAFMFFKFRDFLPKDIKIKEIITDIEKLNKMTLDNELHITAISAGMYPYIYKKYFILPYGWSVGRNYGPVVVSNSKIKSLENKRVAIPGKHTTSYLLLKIFNKKFTEVEMEFRKIGNAIKNNFVDAGVLIHDDQINYKNLKLYLVSDLGKRWFETYKLPIPLGINVVSRKLDKNIIKLIVDAFWKSINYSLKNKDEALEYAKKFWGGKTTRLKNKNLIKKFIMMYVNEDSISLKRDVLLGLKTLFKVSYQQRLIPCIPDLNFLTA